LFEIKAPSAAAIAAVSFLLRPCKEDGAALAQMLKFFSVLRTRGLRRTQYFPQRSQDVSGCCHFSKYRNFSVHMLGSTPAATASVMRPMRMLAEHKHYRATHLSTDQR
jgi:hypothetical protein